MAGFGRRSFKQIMHYARISRNGCGCRLIETGRIRSVPDSSGVPYEYPIPRNTTTGQWRAHGRYVARESATFEEEPKTAGFDGEEKGIDMSGRLGEWQAAGDERLWKVIFSPEFGDRVDLERLTRDVLKRMEQDTCSQLEWVAVVHHNTEHPHVHVALRGRKGWTVRLRFRPRVHKAGNPCNCGGLLHTATRVIGANARCRRGGTARGHGETLHFLDRSIVQRADRTESSWLSVTDRRDDIRGVG